MMMAEKLYSELNAKGIDVIIDDRDERPGVKFKDADLVGFPIRIGIGEKSLAKGEVELKRRGGEMIGVKPEQVAERIQALLKK
jgi:prolyl-tRNA synthetase